jgi:hypothetical protein
LYFHKENSNQSDQDEIIKIFDQAKAPEWHEVTVDSKIDIFEMSLQAFGELREDQMHQPSPTLPVDSKKKVSATSSVSKSSKNPKVSNMW